MIDIYYVEDDEIISHAVEEFLGQRGYRVSVFPTVAGAKEALLRRNPTLVLVDWNMPDGNGNLLVQWIRSKWKELPVIFLTVRGDSCDIVSGFENGADDYMVKPFELDVLLSRIKALLRRAGDVSKQYLSCGSISLDMEKTLVHDGMEEISLSPSEYQLLLYLLQNKGKTVTRRKLLEEIWDSNGNYVNDNTLTVTMKRLREKLHQPACLPENGQECGIPNGGDGMNGRKNIAVLTGLVLAVSLFAVSITTLLLADYYSRAHIQALGGICRKIIEKQPEAEGTILEALKEYKQEPPSPQSENIILAYGYKPSDFWESAEKHSIAFSVIGFLVGALFFLIALLLWRQKELARIKVLTEYLEKVNTGGSGVLLQAGEDDFSKLQDEIYKTVTQLQQTRDAAVKAKNNFAENLYNIAHQIKTPITSISLSLQMMQETPSSKHLEQIHRQLSRMAHLEEALLLLSRIDAGTLSLKREEVDVFTVLMLAAENLQEMFLSERVLVDIPESGEMLIRADMEWTMEAVMNVMKDCMEHTPPGGTVHCSYEQNPLYNQIRIWDMGAGFAKEDIPRLFERFYRGKERNKGGIGIGLALSKALIEAQNGTITARNLTNAGACFEIRFYSH